MALINNLDMISNISSDYIQKAYESYTPKVTNDKDFDMAFKAAMNMIDETNDYSNAAESEEIKFALGQSDNTHDLQVAQEEANIALQFTVAVRDKVISAYQEIMNMQM